MSRGWGLRGYSEATSFRVWAFVLSPRGAFGGLSAEEGQWRAVSAMRRVGRESIWLLCPF